MEPQNEPMHKYDEVKKVNVIDTKITTNNSDGTPDTVSQTQ